jgi:hypothetical protein
VWRDLGLSPDEFEGLPWWQQDIIAEGLQETYAPDEETDALAISEPARVPGQEIAPLSRLAALGIGVS